MNDAVTVCCWHFCEARRSARFKFLIMVGLRDFWSHETATRIMQEVNTGVQGPVHGITPATSNLIRALDPHGQWPSMWNAHHLGWSPAAFREDREECRAPSDYELIMLDRIARGRFPPAHRFPRSFLMGVPQMPFHSPYQIGYSFYMLSVWFRDPMQPMFQLTWF